MHKISPFANLGPLLKLLSAQLAKKPVGGEQRRVNSPHLAVATLTSRAPDFLSEDQPFQISLQEKGILSKC